MFSTRVFWTRVTDTVDTYVEGDYVYKVSDVEIARSIAEVCAQPDRMISERDGWDEFVDTFTKAYGRNI